MNFDFISSIKEFFFDIIGYLIPGFVVLIITSTIFHVSLPFSLDSFVSIVVSYILGYAIYSCTLIKANLIKKKYKLFPAKTREEVEDELSKRDVVILASEYINSKVGKDGKKLEKFRSFRNIAMSQLPDSDKKIYTFMFRAELFDQLHTISILSLIASVALLVLFYLKIYTSFETLNYFMMGVFILLILTLRKGWQRFFEIAMSLPFSLYLTNQSHKNEN